MTGIDTGVIERMANRKITVEVPDTLLEQVQAASGKGVTATVRQGYPSFVLFYRAAPFEDASGIGAI